MLSVRSSVPLLVSVLGLGVLLSSCPAIAAPPAESPVAAPGWTAEDHYRYATRSLSGGRNFARAALHLEETARREPDNIPYRLALGCAYASRAASLAYARTANWERLAEIQSYPRELKDWETERKNAEAEGRAFFIPRPIPPPGIPFPTKDDTRPVTLTGDAFNKEFERLTRAALAAWEEAAKRATTPAEKAEVEYVRGWGILLLHTHRDVAQLSDVPEPEPDKAAWEDPKAADDAIDPDEEDEEAPLPAPWLPGLKEATAAFEEATKLAPDEPRYWQSLGDAREMGHDPSEAPHDLEAHAAYLTALRLEARNAPLWYKLGLQERLTTVGSGKLNADRRKRALDYLTRAAKADPANPAPLHLIAYIHFYGAPYSNIYNSSRRPPSGSDPSLEKLTEEARKNPNQDAARLGLAALEQANLRPSPPRSLAYKSPVPPLLAAAWDYQAIFTSIRWSDMASLRELARAVCGYARFLAAEGDIAQASRAADAVAKVGERLIGDWPVHNRTRTSSEVINVMLGTALAQIGYDTRIALLQQTGAEQEAEQAAKHREVFMARKQMWQQAYQEAGADSLAAYY